MGTLASPPYLEGYIGAKRLCRVAACGRSGGKGEVARYAGVTSP